MFQVYRLLVILCSVHCVDGGGFVVIIVADVVVFTVIFFYIYYYDGCMNSVRGLTNLPRCDLYADYI